jgi:transposase-like protein
MSANIECPKCKSKNGQWKNGFTKAETQRYRCGKCKHTYTPNPKKWAYTEEERLQALRLITDGSTGRGVGRALNMSKANAYRWARELAKKGLT